MNAVQVVGRKTQTIVLMLAGTPGLLDRLALTGASYWERSQLLRMGRLDTTVAKAVVASPLAALNISWDDVAIERLVQRTDRHPFLLQLYDHEAFNTVQAAGMAHFGMVECEAAIRMTRDARQYHYARREWGFLNRVDGLMVAREVALAFQGQDKTLTTMQLKRVPDRLDPEQTMDRWRFLRHKGYIWKRSASGTWEPGIPSLMTYMINQTATLQ